MEDREGGWRIGQRGWRIRKGRIGKGGGGWGGGMGEGSSRRGRIEKGGGG